MNSSTMEGLLAEDENAGGEKGGLICEEMDGGMGESKGGPTVTVLLAAGSKAALLIIPTCLATEKRAAFLQLSRIRGAVDDRMRGSGVVGHAPGQNSHAQHADKGFDELHCCVCLGILEKRGRLFVRFEKEGEETIEQRKRMEERHAFCKGNWAS